MNAAELREALDAIDGSPILNLAKGEKGRVIADAARTVALPILEADKALARRLRERVKASVDIGWHHEPGTEPYPEVRVAINLGRLLLDEILAAISTPTPPQ